MPEVINNKKIFTLLEVTKSIKRTIEKRYTSTFWVKAEMIKLNFYRHSGHCYPDLVEKADNKIVAQFRGILWKEDFLRTNKNFQDILKEQLRDGIKILFQARVCFHPEYGMSLQIMDIDPAYTLGDLEQEKLNTINKLKHEGVFNNNKNAPMALLPKRIAIISVESSKGYADFMKVLEKAEATWKYNFFSMLFPSLLQGNNAAQSIIKQLKRIKMVADHFDVVAIIRGGGGDVGLSCYNNYLLAKEIVSFPIPVLTGIGHSTNETVAELISFENAITPTKLAELLIQQFHDVLIPVENAQKIIIHRSNRILEEERSDFNNHVKLLRSMTKNIIYLNDKSIAQQADNIKHLIKFHLNKVNNIIEDQSQKLQKSSPATLQNKVTTLETIEKNLELLKPENILKRGFSITKFKGKSLTSSMEIKVGDQVETILFDGTFTSIIRKRKNE